MARAISPETEERLIMYFTGELKRKAIRFKKKMEQGFPDEYYCTLNSISYVNAGSNGNHIADPTGDRASKLADISLRRTRAYKHYLTLQQTITDVLRELDGEDIYLLKVYLELEEGGITGASKQLGISYEKARRKVERLLRLFDRKITGVRFDEERKTAE